MYCSKRRVEPTRTDEARSPSSESAQGQKADGVREPHGRGHLRLALKATAMPSAPDMPAARRDRPHQRHLDTSASAVRERLAGSLPTGRSSGSRSDAAGAGAELCW